MVGDHTGRWHLFDLNWSNGSVTLPSGRVITGRTYLPPRIFHGLGARPLLLQSRNYDPEKGRETGDGDEDDGRAGIAIANEDASAFNGSDAAIEEIEAALDPRPPGQSLWSLFTSSCWFVLRANLVALFLACLWALPAVVRFFSITRCLRLPRSTSREREGDGAYDALDRMYHLDSGPEFSWFLFGIVVGLTLSFGPIVWTAVYGLRATRGLAAKWVPLIISSQALLMTANFVVMYRLLRKKYVVVTGQVNVISFTAFPLLIYFATRAVERMVGLVRVAGSFARAYLFLLFISFAYFWVVPRLWFAPGMTDAGRVLIRLLVHPIFFETASFSVRSFVRGRDLKADPSRVCYLVLPCTVLNGLYGRFLVSTSSSTLITVILAMILSLIEVTLRLSVGLRDKRVYAWIRRIRTRRKKKKSPAESLSTTSTRGTDAIERLFSTPVSKRLRADMVALEQVVENASIVTASLLVYLFEMSTDGKAYTVERALTDAGIQLLLEAFTDVTVTVIEERWAGVPIVRAWETRHGGKKWMGMMYMGIISVIFASYFAFVFVNPNSGWTSFRDAK